MHGYDFYKAFTKILINIRGFWVKGLGPKTGPIWPNSENVRNFCKIFFSTSTGRGDNLNGYDFHEALDLNCEIQGPLVRGLGLKVGPT